MNGAEGKKAFATRSLEPVGSTPAQFGEAIHKDIERFTSIMRSTLSGLDVRYRNDETGAPAYPPAVLLMQTHRRVSQETARPANDSVAQPLHAEHHASQRASDAWAGALRAVNIDARAR